VYRHAAKLIAEQIEFELERVMNLLAKTPDWAVFFEDEDEGSKQPPSPLND
jgi:hypothetical protein